MTTAAGTMNMAGSADGTGDLEVGSGIGRADPRCAVGKLELEPVVDRVALRARSNSFTE